MRSYKYRPLSYAKSIGLFIFLSLQSRENSVIKVDLIETTLPKHPPYNTLSYTWGDLLEKVAIDVDGSSLDVAPNFHTFLGYLQQEVVASNKPRYFWADQICVYLDRSRTKCRRNLRVEPLFSKGFGFAHLAFRLSRALSGSNYFASPTSIHTHKPVWAP